MKLFLIALILAGIFIYLNRSYAYFYNYQGEHFITNPLNPKKVEFKTNPKADPKKIVVLGDSLMAGTGSNSKENSLGFLIAENLSKEASLSLINLSHPGVGVADVWKRQVPESVEVQPDYIVLMAGINDVHNKMSEKEFRYFYLRILGALTEKTKAKITVINIPFIGSEKILFPPWNLIYKWRINNFNSIITGAAAAYNLQTIDLNHQFSKQFIKPSELYSYDEFHPSDNGYKLWGEYINANLNR